MIRREDEVSETHKLVVKALKDSGVVNFRGGIQLFADQFDTEYSIAVNFMSTGVHIPIDQIVPEELEGDEIIRICKTFECKI